MLRKSIAIRMNTQGATLYTLWHSLAMQVSALMRQLSVHLVVQGVQIVSRESPELLDNHLLPLSRGLVMVFGPRPQMQKSEKYVSNFI